MIPILYNKNLHCNQWENKKKWPKVDYKEISYAFFFAIKVYNKFENFKPQKENPDNKKIKMEEMKQNIFRELAKVTFTYMKDRESLKYINWQK